MSRLRSLFVALSLVVLVGQAGAQSHRSLRLVGPDGQTVSLRPFEARGRLSRSAWRRLNRALGSRGHARRVMHPRLVASLVQLQRHFGGALIRVSSAYRTSDRWQRDSYHQVGRAVDLRVEGVSNRVVFNYCRTLPRLGCGLYVRGSHVHVDVRGRAAIWVDLSTAAQRPRYVKSPRSWLRLHPGAGQ